MANGFLRALAKVKLVELDEPEEERAGKKPDPAAAMAEVDRILAEEEAAKNKAKAGAKAPPAPRAASPAPRATAPAAPAREAAIPGAGPPAGVTEGKTFDDYYAEAAVPESPYPAEKLLRVLDGLRALDPHTRKAAVLAIDAADDNWAIADVVLDAQRKVRVLRDSIGALQQQFAAIVERAREEKETRDRYLAEATATIQRKIAELEQTLQKEITDIATQKASIDGQVQAADAACRREIARLEAEQQRLHEIPATFVIERSS